jgi:hypothetical protein
VHVEKIFAAIAPVFLYGKESKTSRHTPHGGSSVEA